MNMNAIIQSKTFQSGNSETVRLPKGIGFGPGTEVTIERRGDEVIIRPKQDLKILAEELRQLPSPGVRLERHLDIFPDRPGLYD
jgi:antitoxin VapB